MSTFSNRTPTLAAARPSRLSPVPAPDYSKAHPGGRRRRPVDASTPAGTAARRGRPAACPEALVALGDRVAALDRFRMDDYASYWGRLAPDGLRPVYLRWLFAFASVNQGWATNAALFRAWAALPSGAGGAAFERAARSVRSGLYARAHDAHALSRAYWARPSDFCPEPGEPLRAVRARVLGLVAAGAFRGLGPAKASFALELIRPTSCEVACLDRHTARWLGASSAEVTSGSPGAVPARYEALEDAWLGLCREHDRPSPLVRHALWDDLRGQADTRYWSYCLEGL